MKFHFEECYSTWNSSSVISVPSFCFIFTPPNSISMIANAFKSCRGVFILVDRLLKGISLRIKESPTISYSSLALKSGLFSQNKNIRLFNS